MILHAMDTIIRGKVCILEGVCSLEGMIIIMYALDTLIRWFASLQYMFWYIILPVVNALKYFWGDRQFELSNFIVDNGLYPDKNYFSKSEL